jgi:hypothetical protein
MDIDYTAIGIGISYGVSFFLLYTRKERWNTNLLRWIITVPLFIFGVLSLSGYLTQATNDYQFFSWCLTTPFSYNVFDRLFKKISERMVERDFYLWLNWSLEIDSSIGGDNPHVKGIDILFSILLLVIILALPVFGMG